MFEFLNSNPLIVLAVGVVIVLVLMFIFVKKPGKKKKTDSSGTASLRMQRNRRFFSEKRQKSDFLSRKIAFLLHSYVFSKGAGRI